MQGTSAVPIPSRPLCRTRRRSSSLSLISSPSSSSLWTEHRSPSKPGSKRVKRTRSTTSGEASLVVTQSPLKQTTLPLFEAPEEDSFWAAPNPFALPDSLSGSPPADDAIFRANGGSRFTTSAHAFALPGATRGRHVSIDAGLSSSTASLASSKGSFDDSSSLAGDSPGHSLPSTSSSPQSPYTSDILSRGRSALVGANSSRPQSLRRSSSCGSPMLTDSNTLAPVWDARPADEALQPEAEALHRAAFEQLRHATRADEEGFVERMRRWEAERSARDALFGLGARFSDNQQASLESSEASDALSGAGLEEVEEDEVDILLDPLDHDDDQVLDAHARPPLQRVSHAELDELAQLLRTGACEVQDYSLVRDVQARHRTRTRSAA